MDERTGLGRMLLKNAARALLADALGGTAARLLDHDSWSLVLHTALLNFVALTAVLTGLEWRRARKHAAQRSTFTPL
jgi:hypothetical protein